VQDFFSAPTRWVGTLQGTDMAWGVILVVTGLIYCLAGWRVFKALMVVNMGCLGAMGGAQLGWAIYGASWLMPAVLGLVGAIVLGYCAVPLARWAACLWGAIIGALVGALLASTFGTGLEILLTGAAAGAVITGSMVFVAFEHVVILFFSFQGGIMTIVGALILTSEQGGFMKSFRDTAERSGWLLPFCVIAMTVIGASLQFGGLRAGGTGRIATSRNVR